MTISAVPSTHAEKRLPRLDAVRGVAILLVMLFHFTWYDIDHAYGWIASAIPKAGWTGVNLFFVLSGFLITGILLDTRDHPRYFRNFYVRRLLRIFPLYYAALVIA